MASVEHRIAAAEKSPGLALSPFVKAEVPACNRESQPISHCGLVFLVMIALLSFSISVRAIQVNGVLHRSNQSTISNMSTKTKTDVPAAAPIQFKNTLRLVGYVLPRPRLTGATFDGAQRTDTLFTEWLWYSVAVQHRPPPAVLS